MKNYLEPVRASAASMRSRHAAAVARRHARVRASVVAGRGEPAAGQRRRRARTTGRRCCRARSHRLLGTLEPARQHGRPARRARRSRHHAEPAGNQRVPVQHVGRHASRRRVPGLTQFGFNVDTGKAVGLPGGTFNVSALQTTAPTSRSAICRRCRPQPASRRIRPRACGFPVPAVAARRQGRREGRPAERRPGIHGEPERGDVHERDVRLARAAVDRPAGRRPRVSAVVARRGCA